MIPWLNKLLFLAKALFLLAEYEDQDLDDRTSNKQSVRERRRPKERRRGTGISFFTKDVGIVIHK